MRSHCDALPGALLCYLELKGKPRQQLVSGYAVWPDVSARIFLGEVLRHFVLRHVRAHPAVRPVQPRACRLSAV